MEIIRDEQHMVSSFPRSNGFCPTDEELVGIYLKNKVLNRSLPSNFIREVNLYNYSPQQLFDVYQEQGERIVHFFTQRKCRDGNHLDRSTCNGYWKATGDDVKIGSGENPTGYRKALVYYQGKSEDVTESDWIMHEYRIREESPIDDMKLDDWVFLQPNDWVLCKLYKRENKTKNNNNDDGIVCSTSIISSIQKTEECSAADIQRSEDCSAPDTQRSEECTDTDIQTSEECSTHNLEPTMQNSDENNWCCITFVPPAFSFLYGKLTTAMWQINKRFTN